MFKLFLFRIIFILFFKKQIFCLSFIYIYIFFVNLNKLTYGRFLFLNRQNKNIFCQRQHPWGHVCYAKCLYTHQRSINAASGRHVASLVHFRFRIINRSDSRISVSSFFPSPLLSYLHFHSGTALCFFSFKFFN